MDKRRQRTREAIEDAFVELIDEQGYARTTVQDILERSGVGRATFYAQFHGKDDLLEAQVCALCDHALAAVPACPRGAAARMTRSFLLHHIAASFVGMVRWWAWNDFAATPRDLATDYLNAILPLFGESAPVE